MLYDSLYNKIMKLDDEILIYPAHGSGTQCGKNLSSETFSTLGNQKINNYALNFKNSKDFTDGILLNLPKSPSYFKDSAYKNKNGYRSQSKLLENSLISLDKSTFLRYYKDDYFILNKEVVEMVAPEIKDTPTKGYQGGGLIMTYGDSGRRYI